MMMFMFMLMLMMMLMMMMTVLLCFTCGHKEVDFQLQSRGWTNPWNWNSGLANSIVIDMKSSSNSLYFDKNKKMYLYHFVSVQKTTCISNKIKKTNVAACQTIPRSSWNYFSLHPGLLARGSKEIHCITAKKHRLFWQVDMYRS